MEVKSEIYVVTAHRNTRSQHSYVVGVYEKLEYAKNAAEIESYNRGGKYSMNVTSYILNAMPDNLIDND